MSAPTFTIRFDDGSEGEAPMYDSHAGRRAGVYMAKQVSGHVIAYSRSYTRMGVIVAPDWPTLMALPHQVSFWPAYTGGDDGTAGDAIWFDRQGD